MLTDGMTFGESVLLGRSDKDSFFNAIAMSDCICLQLDKADFDNLMNSNDRKILNEKIQLLNSIPEFRMLTLTRSKLTTLCQNLIPESCIKNAYLC